MKRLPFLAAFALLLLAATPAPAANAIERFWSGFKGYWGTSLASLGGIVGVVLLMGAAAIFIITRGKWLK